MNCRNCGGAMELVAVRGYFFCRYCGSFHFPESAGDDGIRILGAHQPPLPCVTCREPLVSALLDESVNVRYCGNCRGVLMPRASFATVVHKRRAWATGQPAPPVPLNRAELERKVNCPACGNAMATHPYYGPGNVIMDSCEHCEVVWLDFGELKQIVAAPGRDRGTREQVLRDRADTPAGSGISGASLPSAARPVDLLDLVWRLFR
jgi:Zn-finger nucleic acid-binding protein